MKEVPKKVFILKSQSSYDEDFFLVDRKMVFDWFYWTVVSQIFGEVWLNIRRRLGLTTIPVPGLDKRLDGKTVIVTGANRGVGKEIVSKLASRGARVILACRDVNAAEKAKEEILDGVSSAHLEVMKVDMESFSSIRSFAECILSRGCSIDILINNAGIAEFPFKKTKDGIPSTLVINYFGPVFLMMLLLPKIKESHGKIINVGSIFHGFTSKLRYFPFAISRREVTEDLTGSEQSSYLTLHLKGISLYAEAKSLLIMFSIELNRLVKGVQVLATDPGGSKTDIARSSHLIELLADVFSFSLRTVSEAADSVLMSVFADASTPDVYFMNGKARKTTTLVDNEETRQQVFYETLSFLGMKGMLESQSLDKSNNNNV